MKNRIEFQKFIRRCAVVLALCGFALPVCGQPVTVAPSAPVHSDLTLLQCGNLIYAGNQSSVCFADHFLTDAAQQTNLRINPKFCPVRLDVEALFDYPFCVMSATKIFRSPKRSASSSGNISRRVDFCWSAPVARTRNGTNRSGRKSRCAFPNTRSRKSR